MVGLPLPLVLALSTALGEGVDSVSVKYVMHELSIITMLLALLIYHFNAAPAMLLPIQEISSVKRAVQPAFNAVAALFIEDPVPFVDGTGS